LAGLCQWFFSQNSTIPSLGASGAIAGVLGAYIFRFPRAEVLTLIPLGFFLTTVRLPAFFFLGFWFVQQAFYGIASLQARSKSVWKVAGLPTGHMLEGLFLGQFLLLYLACISAARK